MSSCSLVLLDITNWVCGLCCVSLCRKQSWVYSSVSFQAAWDFCTVMASAAPPKRVVSSVFITLASPHRATVTPQQQPTLQAHSAPAREKLHPAVRVSPGDSIPALRHSREDKSPPSESYGSLKSKGLTNAGSSALVSGPQSHNPPKREPGKTQLQEKNDQRSSSGIYYILDFFSIVK